MSEGRFSLAAISVLDHEDEHEVLYAAPLARPLLGAVVGEEREIEIGETRTSYRVVAIE